MRMTRALRTADDRDAHTRWRHVLYWHRGERRRAKRRTNRRERRDARAEITEQVRDGGVIRDR